MAPEKLQKGILCLTCLTPSPSVYFLDSFTLKKGRFLDAESPLSISSLLMPIYRPNDETMLIDASNSTPTNTTPRFTRLFSVAQLANDLQVEADRVAPVI